MSDANIRALSSRTALPEENDAIHPAFEKAGIPVSIITSGHPECKHLGPSEFPSDSAPTFPWIVSIILGFPVAQFVGGFSVVAARSLA